MGNNPTTAPVTPDLLSELISTEEMLAHYGEENARLNDAKHYGAAVLQLEALAKAVLASQSSGSLLAPQTTCARFQVRGDSPVTRTMDAVLEYLAADAANLLRHEGGALSKYHKDHTVKVVGMLAALHGRIKDSVRRMAGSDLSRISAEGSQLLVYAAVLAARIADGDVDGVKTAAGEDRCDVEFVGGSHCSKPVGHRKPGSDDPHTPN